jgi:hypothetical protein
MEVKIVCHDSISQFYSHPSRNSTGYVFNTAGIRKTETPALLPARQAALALNLEAHGQRCIA